MLLTFLLTATPTQTLIDKLGDAAYSVRARAYSDLEFMDVEALPELKANIFHSDPEVKYSVRKLITKIVNPTISRKDLPELCFVDEKYRYIPCLDLLSPFNISYWDLFTELRTTVAEYNNTQKKPSDAQVALFGMVNIDLYYGDREDPETFGLLMLVSELRWEGKTLDEIYTIIENARAAQRNAYSRNRTTEDEGHPGFGLFK
jgi:hypothetical protein